jgi:hypothetical protein
MPPRNDSSSHKGSASVLHEGDHIFEYVDRLRFIGQKIQMLNLMLVFSILLTSTPIMMVALKGIRTIGYAIEPIYFLSTTGFFMAIMCLVLYDRLRKNGDNIFDEITSELQWMSPTESLSNKQFVPDVRPSLSVRIGLRDYVTSANLPFARGRNGPIVYFIFTGFVWILAVAARLYVESQPLYR